MRAGIAVLLAFIVAAPALAGCIGATDSSVRLTPYVALATAEPGRPTEFALFVENRGAFREDLAVSVEGLPRNWSFESELDGDLRVNGSATASVIVTVTPAEDAAFGLHELRVRAGGASTSVFVDVDDLGPEPARRGVGAQVFTVGFWDNGTIFYTNMKDVRDNSRLERVKLDEDADADENMVAIKAYVGREGNEPIPEPYNSSGYVPLIEGFDERMREGNGGMRGGETLTVRIPPEKAYTRPGREDHRLYGDPINFVIHIVSVDVLTDDRLVKCPPDLPECPQVPPPAVAAPRLLAHG